LQIDGNKETYAVSYNYGIYLYSSSDNTITDNTCNNNDFYAISLYSSSNNTITGNTCNNNFYAIYLHSSSDNTVTGNTCNNNICSIYLYSSINNNTVTGNTCNNNNFGIYLVSSSDNTVTGNTCNNNIFGIYLYSSSNNTVTGNTCNNNDYGIRLYSSSNNNTVTGNTCIRGTGQTSDYASDQYTIILQGTANNYNLISSNNCMGKAPVVGGGTGNTVINNKWNATSDFEDLAAASGDIAYTHHQTSASREWLVCHNLGKYPSVTVVDSAGSVVVGDVAYLNTEELIIRFTSEFSGRAFLN
jgi:parallel beta-helix repeat protein